MRLAGQAFPRQLRFLDGLHAVGIDFCSRVRLRLRGGLWWRLLATRKYPAAQDQGKSSYVVIHIRFSSFFAQFGSGGAP